MPRFPPSEAMDKSERAAWVAALNSSAWPKADITDEERFEDWLDAVAGLVRETSYNMDETVMVQLLWARIPSAKQISLMGVSRRPGVRVEDFVSEVARKLFPSSNYVAKAYYEAITIENGDFQNLAELLNQRITRYVRLAHRWGAVESFSRKFLERRILDVASPQWRQWFASKEAGGTLFEILHDLTDRCGWKGTAVLAVGSRNEEAQDDSDDEQDILSPQQVEARHLCHYCGFPRHARDEYCPARGTRCHNCGKVGHWRGVCRTTYYRDVYGKPSHSVTQTAPGRLQVKVGGDTTRGDKLQTASRIIRDERTRYDEKRHKDAARRKRDTDRPTEMQVDSGATEEHSAALATQIGELQAAVLKIAARMDDAENRPFQ
ncbi:hypothetical protein GNI_216000 [Gregarina niphandrodes]|uniref:CCHC-type domain-containing protein n=1 Tax=Gregarina niphandrodes TaxID=110365 RepID=A0A023AW77_GRENI|nr:hypothetical protein GNI_216000 [Gregarina niphandrodes]EZG42852.1 hypothetical protein GNI_216000 [Gregarina niphandrodes]|eukprot:XP_011133869.1 hypothetical protein GNI_216000 [Gregarina niphandrodes]